MKNVHILTIGLVAALATFSWNSVDAVEFFDSTGNGPGIAENYQAELQVICFEVGRLSPDSKEAIYLKKLVKELGGPDCNCSNFMESDRADTDIEMKSKMDEGILPGSLPAPAEPLTAPSRKRPNSGASPSDIISDDLSMKAGKQHDQLVAIRSMAEPQSAPSLDFAPAADRNQKDQADTDSTDADSADDDDQIAPAKDDPATESIADKAKPKKGNSKKDKAEKRKAEVDKEKKDKDNAKSDQNARRLAELKRLARQTRQASKNKSIEPAMRKRIIKQIEAAESKLKDGNVDAAQRELSKAIETLESATGKPEQKRKDRTKESNDQKDESSKNPGKDIRESNKADAKKATDVPPRNMDRRQKPNRSRDGAEKKSESGDTNEKSNGQKQPQLPAADPDRSKQPAQNKERRMRKPERSDNEHAERKDHDREVEDSRRDGHARKEQHTDKERHTEKERHSEKDRRSDKDHREADGQRKADEHRRMAEHKQQAEQRVRLYHLLRAADHLQAAGKEDLAKRVRNEANAFANEHQLRKPQQSRDAERRKWQSPQHPDDDRRDARRPEHGRPEHEKGPDHRQPERPHTEHPHRDKPHSEDNLMHRLEKLEDRVRKLENFRKERRADNDKAR